MGFCGRKRGPEGRSAGRYFAPSAGRRLELKETHLRDGPTCVQCCLAFSINKRVSGRQNQNGETRIQNADPSSAQDRPRYRHDGFAGNFSSWEWNKIHPSSKFFSRLWSPGVEVGRIQNVTPAPPRWLLWRVGLGILLLLLAWLKTC